MITIIAIILFFGLVYYIQHLVKQAYASLKNDMKKALDSLSNESKKDDEVIEIQKEDINKM